MRAGKENMHGIGIMHQLRQLPTGTETLLCPQHPYVLKPGMAGHKDYLSWATLALSNAAASGGEGRVGGCLLCPPA